MRILLVNPPNCGRSIPEELYGIGSLKMILRGEPLALEALAGNLESHEVRIVDLKADPGIYEEILADFKPDIVGITGVTCEAETMLKLASTVKDNLAATVVVGGIHASNDPQFFNREQIDYIVIGLGKLSFRELVSAIEQGGKTDTTIPGVAKTKPDSPLAFIPRIYSADDLVEMAPPRYDLVETYRKYYVLESLGFSLGMVSTAFGCPYTCAFCCIGKLTGGCYLMHDPDTVLRDIRLLGDIPVIRLVDANTFGNPAHSRSLCEKIQGAGLRKNFVADVRSDTIVHNPELFRQWRAAGLRSVIVGFEEVDDGKLSAMEKKNTAAVNAEAISILHDLGITIVGDFIISPDYDEGRFERLRSYLEKHPVDLPMFSILTPLPGTRLFQSMKDRIVIDNLDYYTLTNAVIATKMEEKAFYENYADLMKSGHAGAKL